MVFPIVIGAATAGAAAYLLSQVSGCTFSDGVDDTPSPAPSGELPPPNTDQTSVFSGNATSFSGTLKFLIPDPNSPGDYAFPSFVGTFAMQSPFKTALYTNNKTGIATLVSAGATTTYNDVPCKKSENSKNPACDNDITGSVDLQFVSGTTGLTQQAGKPNSPITYSGSVYVMGSMDVKGVLFDNEFEILCTIDQPAELKNVTVTDTDGALKVTHDTTCQPVLANCEGAEGPVDYIQMCDFTLTAE